MQHNYISIGLPVYNAELYLEYAIKSVLAQTHEFWELIIIDDGSTDESLNIARKYEQKDNRIRVISDGKNKKLPERLNQLIAESSYDYIARMDADDIMHPERLYRQLEFLTNNPQYDLVSSGMILINSYNIVYGYRNLDKLNTDFSSEDKLHSIIHPSIFAKKSWYMRNQYDTNFPRAEDFELWFRSINKNDFKMAVLPDLLLYYREDGNIDKTKMINSYNDILKIYKKYKSNLILKKIIITNLKKSIIKALDMFGYLQLLAKTRKTKDLDTESKEIYQNIINYIISKDY